MDAAEEAIGRFLTDSSLNVKCLGIRGLTEMVIQNQKYAMNYQAEVLCPSLTFFSTSV